LCAAQRKLYQFGVFINLGTGRRFHCFLAIRPVDADINTLVFQHGVMGPKVGIKDYAEGVDGSNLWIKSRVIPVWKEISVQVIEADIRELVAMISLNNNDGRRPALLNHLAQDLRQTAIDELCIIEVPLDIDLAVDPLPTSF